MSMQYLPPTARLLSGKAKLLHSGGAWEAQRSSFALSGTKVRDVRGAAEVPGAMVPVSTTLRRVGRRRGSKAG